MDINYSDDSLTEFGIDEIGMGEPYGSPSLGLLMMIIIHSFHPKINNHNTQKALLMNMGHIH